MSVRPDVGLEQLIDGLELELLAAPDEEFVAGARDLGMNLEMRGSAAFIGVKNYLNPRLLQALLQGQEERLADEPEAAGTPECSGRPKRNADA